MDLDYLLRRLETEREATTSATCREAFRAHAELARQYEARIAVLRGEHRVALRVVHG